MEYGIISLICMNIITCIAVEQKPVPATSQEDDAVFILSSDDVGITVKNEDVKTHVEKPNDFMELTIVACLFNFLFAMVAMSLSCKWCFLLLK